MIRTHLYIKQTLQFHIYTPLNTLHNTKNYQHTKQQDKNKHEIQFQVGYIF